MQHDKETWQAAGLLVDSYGFGALGRAAQRSTDCMKAGDAEGAAVWNAILDAVGRLLDTSDSQLAN